MIESSIRRLEKAVAYGKNSSNIVSSDNGLVLPSMEEAFTVVDKRGNSCRPRPKSAVVTRRSNAKEIHVDVKLVSDEQHRNQHAPLIYEEVQPRPTTAFPAKHVHSDEQDVPTILSDKERIYHHQRAFSDITDLKKVSDADTSEVPYCNKEKVSIPSKSEVPRQYRHKKTDITPSEQATQLGYAAVYQKAKNNHHFQFGEVRKKDTIVQLRQQKDYNIITGEY